MFHDHFEVITRVAETKSFSKAARLLHLSQPAVSSKVQALEDFYGIRLFNRTAQGVTLTDAGKILCDYALRFVDLNSSMENDLQALSNVANHILRIGASCTSGNYAMPCSIQAFKAGFPQANVKLDISNSDETLKKLKRKEIEVAIVDGPVAGIDQAIHYLDSVKLVFIAGNNHGKKFKQPIAFEELRSHQLFVREEGAAMRIVMENLAAQNGCSLKDFHVISEMNSLYSIKAAVEAGNGMTIMPLVAVQREIDQGILHVIYVEDVDLSIDINLVYSNQEEISFIAQNFVRFLTDPQQSGFCWNNTSPNQQRKS